MHFFSELRAYEAHFEIWHNFDTPSGLFLGFQSQNHMNGYMDAFLPASEANVGQEVFLPADPWELLKSGKIADVPLITGVVKDEAGLFAPGREWKTFFLAENDCFLVFPICPPFSTLFFLRFMMFSVIMQNVQMVDENFDKFLADDLNFTDSKRHEIGESIRKFYFNGQSIASDPQQAINVIIV